MSALTGNGVGGSAISSTAPIGDGGCSLMGRRLVAHGTTTACEKAPRRNDRGL